MPTDTFDSSGTWTAPAGVSSPVTVEIWGTGGGGGGGDGIIQGGGGGGGGSYVLKAWAVTAGNNYTATLGAAGAAGGSNADGGTGGDCWFDNSITGPFVFGSQGGTKTGGAGVSGSASNFDTNHPGGNGGTGPSLGGGGGGSSGGTSADGNGGSNGSAGVGGAGGVAPTGGFKGGDGNGSGAGQAGTAPGGGGGGGSSTGGAGGHGRITVTYTTTATGVGVGIRGATATVSPPPFPGGVVLARAPFGTPPPDVPNVGYRKPIETPSPPPFAGGILAVVNQFGTPPANVAWSALSQFRVETPSPPPFAGGAMVISNRAPIQPGSIPGQVVGPGQSDSFPGGALTAERTLRGLPALSRHGPIRVETVSPPPFEGGVLMGRPRQQEVRPDRRFIIRADVAAPEVRQPVSYRGTPAREAVRPAPVIVAGDFAPAFPGRVQTYRGAFGLTSLPARPVRVELAPERIEPGRVVFSTGVRGPTAPVQRPASIVVSVGADPFPGGTIFSTGRGKPVIVAPRPMIVMGGMEFAEAVQPFFGWGYRTGTGEPSAGPDGSPVTLYGYDLSVFTLTSLDCCESL